MYAIINLEKLGDSLVIVGFFLAHLLDLGLSTRQRRCKFAKYVAVNHFITRLESFQTLFQQTGLGLDLANLLCGLCAIVGLRSGIVTGHDFHETVGFLEIVGGAATNEFLQFGGLRFLVFFLHLLGRF